MTICVEERKKTNKKMRNKEEKEELGFERSKKKEV